MGSTVAVETEEEKGIVAETNSVEEKEEGVATSVQADAEEEATVAAGKVEEATAISTPKSTVVDEADNVNVIDEAEVEGEEKDTAPIQAEEDAVIVADEEILAMAT